MAVGKSGNQFYHEVAEVTFKLVP